MAAMNTTMLVGVFNDEAQAQQALTALREAGFEQAEFLRRGRTTSQTGGLFSGIKRLFAGDNAAGEDVADNLASVGIPTDDARHYQQEYEAGRSIVTVRAPRESQQQVREILSRSGAQLRGASTTTATSGPASTTEVNRAASAQETTASTATDGTAATTSAADSADTLFTPPTEDMSDAYDRRDVPLREERLNVTKQPRQTGEVELHKEVVNEQQSINVPVTHEEVVVTKHPVTDATNDTTPIGQDEEIRVPVTEERVHTTKTPVVTGEVSLEKRDVQETERVADTTKREEVQVEREGNAPIHGTPTDPFHYKPQQRGSADKPQGKSQPRAKSRKKR